ncbi:hypothetical protein PybrP1_007373 [[Pythium] brassicae (nom. inval.)]|nr:hypothetical protein PybrP1_007373 [[Pythium] brassicae (nom. inval.)]
MTHRQPPGLICGTSGHLARTCTARQDDLNKKHCIDFTQADLLQTPNKMGSFTSAEEMRSAFTTDRTTKHGDRDTQSRTMAPLPTTLPEAAQQEPAPAPRRPREEARSGHWNPVKRKY